MNRQEAKFILRAYRHSGQDADDPQFAEALEMAKHDPELAAWFSTESLIDSGLQQKVVAAIPIPPDLKRRLLAAKQVIRPVVWWRRREWLTAAALILLLSCLAALLMARRPAARLADLRQFAVQASRQEAEHVALRQDNLEQIRQWLFEHQGSADFVLPAGLLGLSPMGCRVLEWQERKVSLICFGIDGGKHVDLYIITQAAWADAELDSKPQPAKAKDFPTLAWSIGKKTYVLACADAGIDLSTVLHKGA